MDSTSVAPLEAPSTSQAPPVDRATPTVWDLPLRLFHLALLLSVATALVTAWVGGNAMAWHGRAGAVVAGLLGFRLVWGVVGSPTSQFRQFLPRPAALRDYVQGRWRGVGHNPLGALAVVAILAALGGQVLTGLFSTDEIAFAGPYAAGVSESLSLKLTAWHHRWAWGVYGLLGLHVVAIAVHVGVKRHRLLRPMFRLGSPTGPTAVSASGGASPRRRLAALSCALAACLAFAALSWEREGPPPATSGAAPGAQGSPPGPAAW